MVEESVKMMICDWHLAMEMKFKSSSSRDEHIQGWLQVPCSQLTCVVAAGNTDLD